MRTSLNNIKELDEYYHEKLDPQDSLLIEARLLTNPLLRLNFFFQKKTYALIQLHHRRKLREEAATAQHNLFNDPAKADFQQNIYQLFK